jgi:sugar lactone lactonase YvrE
MRFPALRFLALAAALALAGCTTGGSPVASPSATSVAESSVASPGIGPYAGAVATIPIADGPRGVAWAGGSIWVASTLGGVVQRVDPDANEVIAEIDVGDRPVTLVTVGDDLWVSVLNGDAPSDDELVQIDMDADAAGRRVTVPVHHNIAAGGGLIWVQDLDGELRAVDPETAMVTDVVATGFGPVALAASEDAAYGIRSGGGVWRWPIGQGELSEAELDILVPGRSRVAASGDGVWVAVPGRVLALDPASLEVLAELSLTELSLVNDLYVTESGVWLSANVFSDELNLAGGSVLRLDPATLEIRQTWSLGPESSGVVVAEESVWAVDQSEHILARFPLTP